MRGGMRELIWSIINANGDFYKKMEDRNRYICWWVHLQRIPKADGEIGIAIAELLSETR
jgi:hypothetical protein